MSDQTGNHSSTGGTAGAGGSPDARTEAQTVLVTGATGYIGGRLVPRLLDAGHRVKVLVRSPEKIAGVPWLDDVEVVRSSLDDSAAWGKPCRAWTSCTTWSTPWRRAPVSRPRKRPWPSLWPRLPRQRSVRRIVYLGGLHPRNTELSTHMRSREAVGEVFLAGPVDAIVFQAGVVIGSGSASFEMIRHLAETLPLMPAPSWVRNRIEAIAVRDVLYYLVGAASLDGTTQPHLRHRLPGRPELRRA